MTDNNPSSFGPFATTDSEAHQDPSTSSGVSPPENFFELLVSAGMPADDGYAALSFKFLRGGQADLLDEGFLAIYEGARATSAENPIYPGAQSKLFRNAGVSVKNATRVVKSLLKLGFVERLSDGRLSFAPFWNRFPVGKEGDGEGRAFLKAPGWLLFNLNALGCTPRDLRILTILGSYYFPLNPQPTLGGAQLGDFLGVVRSQAAEDLRRLTERTGLTHGFVVGSRTARGYSLEGLRVLVGKHTGAFQPRQAVDERFNADLKDFFGEPRQEELADAPHLRARPSRKNVKKSGSKIQPDRVHKELAACLKKNVSVLDEDQHNRALGIAQLTLGGRALSATQEFSLYRDAARASGVSWNPAMSAKDLRLHLVRELGLWRSDPGRVRVLADIEFGQHLSKEETIELAMSCGSDDEVRAALSALGSTAHPKSNPQ